MATPAPLTAAGALAAMIVRLDASQRATASPGWSRRMTAVGAAVQRAAPSPLTPRRTGGGENTRSARRRRTTT